jgi:hypothetical protein
MIYSCMDLSTQIGQGVQIIEEVLLGYVFSLSFATISWARRKQKFVALSTTEAEYITACDACTEVMWLLKPVSVLFDQVLDSTVIYYDNPSSVKLSENPVFHDRLKHIEIKHCSA